MKEKETNNYHRISQAIATGRGTKNSRDIDRLPSHTDRGSVLSPPPSGAGIKKPNEGFQKFPAGETLRRDQRAHITLRGRITARSEPFVASHGTPPCAPRESTKRMRSLTLRKTGGRKDRATRGWVSRRGKQVVSGEERRGEGGRRWGKTEPEQCGNGSETAAAAAAAGGRFGSAHAACRKSAVMGSGRCGVDTRRCWVLSRHGSVKRGGRVARDGWAGRRATASRGCVTATEASGAPPETVAETRGLQVRKRPQFATSMKLM
ncbi:hypothetical protein B296_00047033 [Ensete ventricosum]|uniref:Uncharacterized protein n=1 Tax=Ensete ventricosum TaxID=4639 RepID=A0A426Y8J4_ENSVE|nr:hypothetical protein B296_00047033 [Ensete ventricosum]